MVISVPAKDSDIKNANPVKKTNTNDSSSHDGKSVIEGTIGKIRQHDTRYEYQRMEKIYRFIRVQSTY